MITRAGGVDTILARHDRVSRVLLLLLLCVVWTPRAAVLARRWRALSGSLPTNEDAYTQFGREAVEADEAARTAAAAALGIFGHNEAQLGGLLQRLRGTPWLTFRQSFPGSDDAAGLWFAAEHRLNATRSAAVRAYNRAYEDAQDQPLESLVIETVAEEDPMLLTAEGSQLVTSGLKLLHDVEQLKYLMELGRLPPSMSGIVNDMEATLMPMRRFRRGAPPSALSIFPPSEWLRVAGAYNRLLYQLPDEAHVLDPGLPLLNPNVDWTAMDEEFQRSNAMLGGKKGVVVIDNFLSQHVISNLRRLIWESTVWFDLREGYLGAYAWKGLNTSVLFRVAQALQRAMPRTLGGHNVRQIWSYKYGRSDYATDSIQWPDELVLADGQHDAADVARGIKIHADQAVINVNFWITGDECNADPESGGMKVYRSTAPRNWTFAAYNGLEGAAMRTEFVKNAAMVRVPHRSNRVVMFHSSLLHETDVMSFKPGYKCRRVNLTFLYGEHD